MSFLRFNQNGVVLFALTIVFYNITLQENIKDSEGKNRRNFVGISLFRRNSDETRRRK